VALIVLVPEYRHPNAAVLALVVRTDFERAILRGVVHDQDLAIEGFKQLRGHTVEHPAQSRLRVVGDDENQKAGWFGSRHRPATLAFDRANRHSATLARPPAVSLAR